MPKKLPTEPIKPEQSPEVPKKAPIAPKVKPTTVLAAVVLTEKELTDLRDILADQIQEKADVEEELGQVKSHFKGRLQGIENVIKSCARKISSRSEFREVPATVRWDFATGIKTTTRDDTGEILKQEAITDKERQLEMV